MIIDSNMQYLGMSEQHTEARLVFFLYEQSNIWAIWSEWFLLSVALIYLKWRKFDFQNLNFQMNAQTFYQTITYILLASSCAFVFEYL